LNHHDVHVRKSFERQQQQLLIEHRVTIVKHRSIQLNYNAVNQLARSRRNRETMAYHGEQLLELVDFRRRRLSSLSKKTID